MKVSDTRTVASTGALVVFDVDGPLLDTAVRQHTCYALILREFGAEPWGLERYWGSKRSGASNERILIEQGLSGLIPEFHVRWRDMIESDEALGHDGLQPSVVATLTAMSRRGAVLAAVTLRQRPDGVRAQLARLGLENFFSHLIVVPHSEGGSGKARRLRERAGAPALWVGDTEVDVEAARLAGCPMVAITTGIRSRERLALLGPDWMVDSIAEVPAIAAPFLNSFSHV